MWTGAATGQERETGTTFEVSNKFEMCRCDRWCRVAHMGTRCHSFVQLTRGRRQMYQAFKSSLKNKTHIFK